MDDKDIEGKGIVIAGAVLMVLVYLAGAYFHYNYVGKTNPAWHTWNKQYNRLSERYKKLSEKPEYKSSADEFFIPRLKELRDKKPPRKLDSSMWKTLTYPIIPAYMVFLFITKSLREFIFGVKDKEQDKDEDEKIQD